MTVFLSVGDGEVIVQARASGNGAVGDLMRVVTPDKTFLGHSFEDLAALGSGEHELEPKADRG